MLLNNHVQLNPPANVLLLKYIFKYSSDNLLSMYVLLAPLFQTVVEDMKGTLKNSNTMVEYTDVHFVRVLQVKFIPHFTMLIRMSVMKISSSFRKVSSNSVETTLIFLKRRALFALTQLRDILQIALFGKWHFNNVSSPP